MQYLPLNFEQINIAAGTTSPNTVKAYNNKTFAYWQRSLYHRACSILQFEVPTEWDGSVKNFFYYSLFKYGYVAIFDNKQFGMSFQPCTVSGFDFYYQPTKAIITNPALKKSLDLKIGSECELLMMTPDYMGVFDTISYYAEKLSNLDNAINMSIINNKFAFVLAAKNKAAAEALKKIFDKINRGEPAVFVDKALMNDPQSKDTPFQFLERSNLKQSYLTTDQLNDFATIISNFDSEIGIKSMNYQKKERMNIAEATSNAFDSQARSYTWYECLNSSINQIKKLYPDINLSVKLRYLEEGEDENEIDTFRA